MQTQTISGKLYKIVEFTNKAAKTGNSSPCYECDLEQGSDDCTAAKCMEYGKFNFLKQFNKQQNETRTDFSKKFHIRN